MPAERCGHARSLGAYHGRFVRLEPNERVVEVHEFETADSALSGEITITTVADTDGGTDLLLVFEGLPSGVSPTDNELGTRMALDKLAALVESR
jgi:hypothetical protein